MLLIDAEHAEAVSLYRAARYKVHETLLCHVQCTLIILLYSREVWPGAEFGSSGMSVDDEIDGIRDILLNTSVGGLIYQPTGLKNINDCLTVIALPVDGLMGSWAGGGASGDEGDEEEGSKVTTVELEFNINKYIER